MYGKAAAACVLAATLLNACSAAPRQNRPLHAQPQRARRIVTLMPSFADELCALGAGASVAGVSEYSRSATCARNVPEVGNFASIDAEKIVALHPDAVVAIPAQRSLTSPLQRAGVRVVFAADDSLGDIFGDIRLLGSLTGRVREADALIDRLQKQTHRLQASEHFARTPSVFVVLQAQPIWTVGPRSYISALLHLAGARNAVAALPQPYAQYSAEALLRLQPDAIVAGSDVHLESALDRQPWRSLRAVREHHVFILAEPALLERPGPNYNEGLSWLINHLRPLATAVSS